MRNPRVEWRPQCFVEFENFICKNKNFGIAKKHNVRLTQVSGITNIFNLTKAASKWRVAKSANGLDAAIMPAKSQRVGEPIPENSISQDLCNAYSAQLMVSLAVFAFENYGKCFGPHGRDWYQHKTIVFPNGNAELSSQLRSIPKAKDFEDKLSDFLDKKGQKDRLHDFFENGRDEYLYDVCHFIRHGYTHGALRGFEGLIEVAVPLREYILDGIKQHMEGISAECEA